MKVKSKNHTIKTWYKLLQLFLRIAFTAFILFSFSTLKGLNKEWDIKWYRQEVRFSNWRNAGRFDFSTNAVVTYFYSGECPKYLRQENIVEFWQRLRNGDTLTLGIDYYGHFSISSQYIPGMFFSEKYYYQFLNRIWFNEGIYRLKIWQVNNEVRFTEY